MTPTLASKEDDTYTDIFHLPLSSVPEHLTDEQFWQRYLFHKQMIEDEEQKRKLLLQCE